MSGSAARYKRRGGEHVPAGGAERHPDALQSDSLCRVAEHTLFTQVSFVSNRFNDRSWCGLLHLGDYKEEMLKLIHSLLETRALFVNSSNDTQRSDLRRPLKLLLFSSCDGRSAFESRFAVLFLPR
jgi:hypothetical protein